jgi:colanic acid/amylovoran biosynthesis protein
VKPARLLVTDTVMLNTGDAAILIGMLRALREAFGGQIEVDVAELQPEAARRLYPGISFGPTIHACLHDWARGGMRFKLAVALTVMAALLWRTPLEFLARPLLPVTVRRVLDRHALADAVIATGGTYLVPYYRLSPRIVNFLVCLALGQPLVLFTQSLGPFEGGAGGILLRAILRRCRLIFVRDDSSRRHLRAVGVAKSRIVMCADAAFALAPSPFMEEKENRCTGAHPLRVAVSLRDWPHFRDREGGGTMDSYLEAMTELVSTLVTRHRAAVTFVSTCQGEPAYWTDDSCVADRVVDRLPPRVRDTVRVDRTHRSPQELIERFRGFDVVVATRMHAAILALCARRPVMGIAYEFKTRELMQRVGFGELVLDIEDATGARLVAMFERLIRDRATIETALGRRVAAERDDALASGSILRDALFGAPAAA